MCYIIEFYHFYGYFRLEVAIGPAGSGWAGPTVGRAKTGRAKIGPVFRTKILTAQPILKTGPVGQNSLFKAKKKIREGRAGPY